jgi:uncharacterized membrane protein
MKNSTFIQPILTIIFALLPFAYLAYVWDTLPEKVATHFGIDGQPDAFGTKNDLFLPISILVGCSLFVYILMKNIHKIDPKQAAKLPSDTFEKLGFITIVFMSLLSIYIVHSSISNQTGSFLFTIVGLLFMAMGNLMHSLKQNYFAGFKLPWTLNDADNWRKTHQLGSKIWFAGGLCILILSLLLPIKIVLMSSMFLVAIMVIVPIYYSFQLFKNAKKDPSV